MSPVSVFLLVTSVSTVVDAQTVMSHQERNVTTAAELVAAATDTGVVDIVVAADLARVPTLHLSPGKNLRGASPSATLRFAAGQDGVQLSTDNRIENLKLEADVDRRAVYNATKFERMGRLVLRNLRAIGVIQLVARDQVRSGHVEIENVD